MSTLLKKLIEAKRFRVEAARAVTDLDELYARARSSTADRRNFRDSIRRPGCTNIIAEFKRASPSKGIINDLSGATETAIAYEKGGAAAVSVLTEEDHFRGSLEDLIEVRNAVDLPVLRKDFVIDEFQIYESAAAGADAVLLIVAALTEAKLNDLFRLTHELGMDAIVEVHTREEMEVAARVGAAVVGINNRDLESFEVSLDVSRQLIKQRPANALMIAESGISRPEEIAELKTLGFDAFLVGETLMRASNIIDELMSLTTDRPEALVSR